MYEAFTAALDASQQVTEGYRRRFIALRAEFSSSTPRRLAGRS